MIIRTKTKRLKPISGVTGEGTLGESSMLTRFSACMSFITEWLNFALWKIIYKDQLKISSQLGFVEVTVGPDAVKMARSSLGRIHRLQMGRKEVSDLAPSDMKIFQTKIMQCQKALEERDDIQRGATRGRDNYTLDNMVTALNILWDGPDPRMEYSQNFMEMFCISATHNMLLRDEELHHINFSDCFAVVPTQNRQPGAQQRVALTFKLRNNDPTSDANQKLYVSALRHYDIGRCTFSAFAFYMFQIWQVRSRIFLAFIFMTLKNLLQKSQHYLYFLHHLSLIGCTRS